MSDLIDRQAAIDAVYSETVSTNPEHFKSSEKFIKFMDDADIASFGKWQWANGFNTALVATKIQLEKLPSAQPEPQWIPMSEREPESGNYLTTFRKKGDPEDKRDVAIDLYWSGGWDDDGDKFETIAYMQLPEPYKGDE